MSEQTNKQASPYVRTNNHVELVGNIGAEPESKDFESGKKLATFSLCTRDRFEDKNESGKMIETQPEWHRIVAWEGLAEQITEKLAKGAFVRVIGKLRTREFTTKEGGKGYRTEIVAREIQSLTKDPEARFTLKAKSLAASQE